MKKDKTVSVRINSDIKDLIDESGTSVQYIVDEWIEAHIDIETELSIE